ncbi:MAG: S16 family serine protease [Candidatus Woesearchaeota archaeon]
MKKRFLFRTGLMLLMLSLIISTANASYIKLLAVSEENGTLKGSVADLYVEVKPGSGHVFMETFPLTKLDTQISTRFAKNIACSELNIDCSKYDFFYVIRANAPIVGGPSASGAIAALTYIELAGLRIKENISMTGTINSGALIGPVGGLKEKISAAKNFGIKTVLIPDIEIYSSDEEDLENVIINISEQNVSIVEKEIIEQVLNQTNKTKIQNSNESIKQGEKAMEKEDLIAFGRDIGVEVIPISELSDAIYYLTGKNVSKGYNKELNTTEYDKIMKIVSEKLCNRTEELLKQINLSVLGKINQSLLNYSKKTLNETMNLMNNSVQESRNNRFYSSASFCFGANVKASTILLLQENKLESAAKLLSYSIDYYNNMLRKNFETINELQTYLIINERLYEAREHLHEGFKALEENNTIKAAENIAFANERLKSSDYWQEFMKMEGKKYEIDIQKLRDSCLSKIGEAQELEQYVNLIFPLTIKNIENKIKDAESESALGNYEECLYRASEAKAELNLILSNYGIKDNDTKKLLEKKLIAAERSISAQIEKDVIPIMAYSYYEYANSLKETDIYSSLLYAEYAIELSSMDVYFQAKNSSKNASISKLQESFILCLVLGIFVASSVFLSVLFLCKRKSLLSKRNFKFKNSKRAKSK